MKWSLTNRLDRFEVELTVNVVKTAMARRLGRVRRQLVRHVLPFILMLLVTGWLTLQVGVSIEQAKKPQTYADLGKHHPRTLPQTVHD